MIVRFVISSAALTAARLARIGRLGAQNFHHPGGRFGLLGGDLGVRGERTRNRRRGGGSRGSRLRWGDFGCRPACEGASTTLLAAVESWAALAASPEAEIENALHMRAVCRAISKTAPRIVGAIESRLLEFDSNWIDLAGRPTARRFSGRPGVGAGLGIGAAFDHGREGGEDLAHLRALVGIDFGRIHVVHDHRDVGFEDQKLAVFVFGAIDREIVEADAARSRAVRRRGAAAKSSSKLSMKRASSARFCGARCPYRR